MSNHWAPDLGKQVPFALQSIQPMLNVRNVCYPDVHGKTIP